MEKFTEAANHMTGFISSYNPSGSGLGLFFDQSDGFFQHVEFVFQSTGKPDGIENFSSSRWPAH